MKLTEKTERRSRVKRFVGRKNGIKFSITTHPQGFYVTTNNLKTGYLYNSLWEYEPFKTKEEAIEWCMKYKDLKPLPPKPNK